MNFFFNLYKYFHIPLNKTLTIKFKFQFYRYALCSLKKHLCVWNSANKPTQSPQIFALPLGTLQFSVAVKFSFGVYIFFQIFLSLVLNNLCSSKGTQNTPNN